MEKTAGFFHKDLEGKKTVSDMFLIAKKLAVRSYVRSDYCIKKRQRFQTFLSVKINLKFRSVLHVKVDQFHDVTTVTMNERISKRLTFLLEGFSPLPCCFPSFCVLTRLLSRAFVPVGRKNTRHSE